MNTGNETWKWGVVVLLLGVFLITANQAYQHIAKQEVYEAPDDYLKGDSWDLEHQSGPGAGQPTELPQNNNNSISAPKIQNNQRLMNIKQIDFGDKSNWSDSEEKNTKQQKESSLPKSDSNTLSSNTN